MQPELLVTTTKSLLSSMGLDAEVGLVTGSRLVVSVHVMDGTDLVGEGGEYARAVTALVRRLLEKEHGVVPQFVVDIDDFYEKQLEVLRGKAQMLAQRVRLFKQDAHLEPMNAYERLVVHEVFAQDKEVGTRSEGEGPLRHVVLTHKTA